MWFCATGRFNFDKAYTSKTKPITPKIPRAFSHRRSLAFPMWLILPKPAPSKPFSSYSHLSGLHGRQLANTAATVSNPLIIIILIPIENGFISLSRGSINPTTKHHPWVNIGSRATHIKCSIRFFFLSTRAAVLLAAVTVMESPETHWLA